METIHTSVNPSFQKIIPAAIFTGCGSLIIIVFSPYRPLLSDTPDLLGRLILLTALLSAALHFRKHPHLNGLGQIWIGLFILALATSLDWWSARFVLDVLGGYPDTPAGIALEKMKSVLLAAGTIFLLTRAFGGSLGSIYVQCGRLKQSLLIGLTAFGIAAVGAVPMSTLLFAGRQISLTQALGWAPWILLAVLANAAYEELLFRALFLRKLDPWFGKLVSNGLIALVFTGLHLGVTYPKEQLLFLFILIPLALGWGYLMQKTDSIWGSILFHAGTDIPVFLAIFSIRFTNG